MYKKVTLDNGVRLIYEKIPYVKSVSIGIWVGTGSRSENPKNNGVSHFIEHMLFKGTEKRTAKEIAESIDNIGGQLNAFTGKEYTCFYAKVLDSHVDIALDVLSDMFFNSKFSIKDIETERRVVLEEIGMYEDSPEELVHDIFSQTVWGSNPLGYPILGTQESLLNIDRSVIKDYMSLNYRTDNCVIAAAGNIDEAHLTKIVAKYFGSWNTSSKNVTEYPKPEFACDLKIKEKDTEQINLCMGYKGIEHGNDKLYTLLAINNILGGGMSSRLFQQVREEKGLVYSIYSYPSSYKDTGLFTIYAGMNPEHLTEVLELINQEVEYLVSKGISEDELEKSKEQLKGNYILGLESTSSRMNSIGKSELMLGHINTPEEILEKIDKIKMDSVHEVINEVFSDRKYSIAIVGNVKKDLDLEKFIKR